MGDSRTHCQTVGERVCVLRGVRVRRENGSRESMRDFREGDVAYQLKGRTRRTQVPFTPRFLSIQSSYKQKYAKSVHNYNSKFLCVSKKIMSCSFVNTSSRCHEIIRNHYPTTNQGILAPIAPMLPTLLNVFKHLQIFEHDERRLKQVIKDKFFFAPCDVHF